MLQQGLILCCLTLKYKRFDHLEMLDFRVSEKRNAGFCSFFSASLELRQTHSYPLGFIER